MAQSIFERERLVEVNRLLPDIRDFLKDVKKEALPPDIIEQCDSYIERLNAIIQPPSLPPRSGRSATVSYEASDSIPHIKPEDLIREEKETSKPSEHGISAEFLEHQRELSRQATLWKSEQANAQVPYNSKRKPSAGIGTQGAGLIADPKSALYSDERHSAIYEKILSTSTSNEEDALFGVVKQPLVAKKSFEPPPVPERKGRTVAIPDKQEKAVVMVHELKDPLYSGLLRNVRINIKQWGVIMSQKLYLFNDLEKPADFIGDLRFFEVMKDPTMKNVFHVTGRDSHSIILAAVNDDQYQLWYSAFQRAKLLSDAAVGKFDGSGEMAEYVAIGDEDDFDENDYEKPNDLLGNTRTKEEEAEYTEPTNPIISPTLVRSRPRNSSSTSLVYEQMDEKPEEQDHLSQIVERDSWQSQEGDNSPHYEDTIPRYGEESIAYTIPDNENQDYTSLPLPPLPPPSEDVPPELPVRGRKPHPSVGGISLPGRLFDKSEDECSPLSHTGSLQSLDSESDNDIRPIIKNRSPSLTKNSNLQSNSKLKRMRESEFFNDESALFTGILHKRKILAVWQKHYCKVKDEYLLCFRNLDNADPSIVLKLPGYQLDRADETWRKFAFKLQNENDVFYFASENRADLVKWLNVLAKEIHKEKFVAMKDPDTLDMPTRQKSLDRQESTDESEGSQQNDNRSKLHHINNDHTSDFDADNESGGSEASEKKVSITEQLPKNFLQVSKNRHKRGVEDDSPDEPDAQIQGYLYRKFKNHWTSRWCSIKDQKFFIYRHSPRELPEAVVILEFAALTIPHDDGVTQSGGWFLFKLTYEAEQVIILSTKSKEDWVSWTKCIEKLVGSLSEEPFPYINVPASSTLQKNINSHFFPTDEDEVDDFDSFLPEAVSSPLDGHDFTTADVSTLTDKPGLHEIPRDENELDDAYYYSFLTELHILDNRAKPSEYFVVLSKEKLLKFYSDKNSTVPIYVYNALATEVIDEPGVDPCILRIRLVDENKEIVLKTQDQIVCEDWKDKLNIIHYSEIPDGDVGHVTNNTDIPYGVDKNTNEKLFRKRSKSIDKKMKNEPVLISHSKTLPHMGRNKKRAKEQNNVTAKTKRLSYQKSEDATSTTSKKGISQFIRSLTVDTLGRKAKNKSFDFSNDYLLKETHHGDVTEVVTTKSSVTHENRYCRISGKVLYCYACKADVKHIWKVSLKNAAIEDSIENDSLFKIKITAMDTGDEYNLLFDSEEKLDDWLAALSGEDKLHYSSSSPQIARNEGAKSSPTLSAMSLPVQRREFTELSPPIPKRAPNRELSVPNYEEPITLNDPSSPSPNMASPPVPKRLHGKDMKSSDAKEVSDKKPLDRTASESPKIPRRIQSRPSYKKDDEDRTTTTADRTSNNGDNEQLVDKTIPNGQEAAPLIEISPSVPRKGSKPNVFTDSPLSSVNSNLDSNLGSTADRNSLTRSEMLDTSDVSPPPSRDSFRESRKDSNDAEIDGGATKWFSTHGGSLSSLSSAHTTSTLSSTMTTSTLSEKELLSRAKSNEEKMVEDDIVLEEFMNEVRQMELCKTKVLRWLILRKTVLEVYSSKVDKTPCKIINMENSSLVTNDKSANPLTIKLKDSEGFITVFLPQTSSIYKKWTSEIKSIEKKFRRNSKTNSKLPIVGDIIRRRERNNSVKNEDKRKSLLLVEEDYKAVQKYEESTDLSRTISGPLVEYFEDEKLVEKNRHCWIKDGYFYVAKNSKSQKPIKKIDLSTVVILDESDPAKHNYAFRLNYLKEEKERCIMLKAVNQNTADKWMVSVSMGILLHRLKSPQVRTSFELQEPADKDHEFVPLPSSVALNISTPTYPSHSDDFDLGIDIKRELAKKAEDGEEHLMNVNELLQREFPTPDDSPVFHRRKEEVLIQIGTEEEDGGVIADADADESMQDEDLPVDQGDLLTPNAAPLNNLPLSDDVVFSDEDMLENIPDRDNADERFKNVRGILKQQESIRRAIVRRQKTNDSLTGHMPSSKKKIPPKIKPKPTSTSGRRSTSATLTPTTPPIITFNKSVSNPNEPVEMTFEVLKTCYVDFKDSLADLSITDLKNYNEVLENEKVIFFNFLSEQKKKDTNKESSSSETDSSDLTFAQERLHLISSELNRVNSAITRCVSVKLGGSTHMLSHRENPYKLYASAESVLAVDTRNDHDHEKTYNSDGGNEDTAKRRNRRHSSSCDTRSIII